MTASSSPFNFREYFFSCRGITSGDDCVRAGITQRKESGSSDASGGSGDDGHFAVETKGIKCRCCSHPFSVGGPFAKRAAFGSTNPAR